MPELNIKKLEQANPYLSNRKDWNETTGLWRANAVMWRTVAFIMMGITTLAVLGMIYAAQLPDVVPLVYREDASGGLIMVGIPNRALKPDSGALTNQLSGYIRSIREVPLSEGLRQRNIRLVKRLSTSQLFTNNIAPMMRDEYGIVGMGEQLIDIRSAIPLNNHLWQIDWEEYKNSKPVGRFKANIDFTLTKGDFKDPEARMYNPFGIVVKDVVVSQVMGS